MNMVQAKPTGASISELAAEYQVGESTLYALAARGQLPGARRLGKRIVVHRGQFEEWLRSGNGAQSEDTK
jgi:excisionase family DNA binding protein